jgi:hypothetical protein
MDSAAGCRQKKHQHPRQAGKHHEKSSQQVYAEGQNRQSP